MYIFLEKKRQTLYSEGKALKFALISEYFLLVLIFKSTDNNNMHQPFPQLVFK